MRCIFCRRNSSQAKSVEHIVPESLGNKSNILPPGIVCDKCNQYFSIKIEKELLEQAFFKNLRHRNKIESKKGRIPRGKAIIPISNYEAEVILKKGHPATILLDTISFDAINNGETNQIIIPYIKEPEASNRVISRFLGKMAIEAFAQCLLNKEEALNWFIDDKQFDPLRQFVRYDQNISWNYHARKFYAEDAKFSYQQNTEIDMIYEYDFLITDKNEFYFIIILKGYEFTINIGGPSLDGYINWLQEHNQISPLYKNRNIRKDWPQPNFSIELSL